MLRKILDHKELTSKTMPLSPSSKVCVSILVRFGGFEVDYSRSYYFCMATCIFWLRDTKNSFPGRS